MILQDWKNVAIKDNRNIDYEITESYKRGYSAGLKKGKHLAQSSINVQVCKMLTKLESKIEQKINQDIEDHKNFWPQLQSALLNVWNKAFPEFVHLTNSSRARNFFHEVASNVPKNSKVIVHVSGSQPEIAQELQNVSCKNKWEIKLDPSIEVGDIKISWPEGGVMHKVSEAKEHMQEAMRNLEQKLNLHSVGENYGQKTNG